MQAGNFIRGAHAQGFADPGAKQDLDDAIEASARYRAAMKNGYIAADKIGYNTAASAKHFALTGKVNGSPVLPGLDKANVSNGFQNARHIWHSTL